MTESRLQIGFRRASVVFLIALHFIILIASARIKSPTIDEFTYIASGYFYAQTGDFRLDRTHPPLIRLLIGFPLQFMPISVSSPQTEKWDGPASYELGYYLGKEMLLKPSSPVQTLLLAARLPIMLLSCGLAYLLYGWGRKLYGTSGGLTVLVLYVFCPNMLAHAQLATLDLGISFFMALTLYALFLYFQSPGRIRLAFCGIALGAALAAKVTALLLIPVLIAALTWIHYAPGKSIREFPWGKFGFHAGTMLGCSLIVLFLVYGYPLKPFYYLDTLQNVVQKSLASGKGGESIPGMPHRNYAFYLLGNYSTEGWPYYYLVAAAVKTPLAVFAALILFLVAGTRRWRGLSDFLLIGSIALLHGFAAVNRVNIGLRHVLPFYPLLYLYMGRVIELRSRRHWRVILPILGVWYVASCVFIYPDFLSYFNEAAGGPSQGHKYLDDSNIDWGQDLGRLASVKQQYPDEPFSIAQEYIFDPAAYGFSAVPFKQEQIPAPPHGIVAISKQWAIRHRIQKRSPYYFDWLEKYKPISEIGHSIWIFKFEANSQTGG